ncbi:BlaI/MecI/CopY family transcriptional regulator [Candidatus Woesearchaeota archaeon]|nr:BlaI/MecI/CopY family transcriptional regulator [Candidatus Woesearchaeota archaeon]
MKAIKTSSADFESVLSPLEADVLKVLWPNKKLKVREIYNALKPNRKVALSSVAVILDRLYQRKIVERDFETGRGGIRYIYRPVKDRKQFEASVVEDAVNQLINRFGQTAVSYFNERFSKK